MLEGCHLINFKVRTLSCLKGITFSGNLHAGHPDSPSVSWSGSRYFGAQKKGGHLHPAACGPAKRRLARSSLRAPQRRLPPWNSPPTPPGATLRAGRSMPGSSPSPAPPCRRPGTPRLPHKPQQACVPFLLLLFLLRMLPPSLTRLGCALCFIQLPRGDRGSMGNCTESIIGRGSFKESSATSWRRRGRAVMEVTPQDRRHRHCRHRLYWELLRGRRGGGRDLCAKQKV